MSISSRCWRAASAFITAGAAVAAVAGLAVPAGAVTGASQTSPEMAGYTANGAQFQNIGGTVYLRNPAQFAGQVARLGPSVQLWSADVVATVGVKASTSGERYINYATIYDRHTHKVIASNPNAYWWVDREPRTPPGSWHWGGDVVVGIGYDPATGELSMSVDDGYAYTTFYSSYTISPGQSFTEARVGTDFGRSPWDASYPTTQPAAPVKVSNYRDVSLESYSGHRATLWSWWTHHKLLANNGQHQVAVPHDLTNGEANFQTWLAP